VPAEGAITFNPLLSGAYGALRALTDKGKGSSQQRGFDRELVELAELDPDAAKTIADQVAAELAALPFSRSIGAKQNRIYARGAAAARAVEPSEFPDIDELPQEIDFSGPVYASSEVNNAERAALERSIGSSKNLPAVVPKRSAKPKPKPKARRKLKLPKLGSGQTGILVGFDPTGIGGLIKERLEEKAEREGEAALEPTDREKEINAELRKRGEAEKKREKIADEAKKQAQRREIVLLKDRLQRNRELDRELREASKRATRAKAALRKAIASADRAATAGPAKKTAARVRTPVRRVPTIFGIDPLRFANALMAGRKQPTTINFARPSVPQPQLQPRSVTNFFSAPARTAVATSSGSGNCYTVCRKPRQRGQKRRKPRVCLSSNQAKRLGLTA